MHTIAAHNRGTGHSPKLPHSSRRRAKQLFNTSFVLCCVLVGQPAVGQGFAPEVSVRQMKVADGLEVQLVASEPLVRQPVAIEFDDRGRLWVIQYLQYPNPAGLKRVKVDRYSRTKYDRVPPPPPHGPRGADRITILEDSDADGRVDRGCDFVNGLNLATGLAFGYRGVFVLNVPYLLFYPDENRDDVPDSDPQVLLAGFGMEDAHSVANSLTWGPDGWLYGCQGSTVTANVRGIEFQQGVWRYHPVTQEFELFCEGGGNSWGLDFDRQGYLFYSTNYGGHVLLHGVPGGYFVKSFAKHGALHNPHAYGYFEHAPHQNFRGGHVTVGGVVYQGGSFPDRFRGKYIAGDLVGHAVYWHDILPLGSTVQTSHGGELLVSNDTWFAPTDLTVGPDGAVYVADWHDARTAHPDPDADWDRSNGRIYRIAPAGTPPPKPIDFANLSTQELVRLHQHRNRWFVRRARMELAFRRAELERNLAANREAVEGSGHGHKPVRVDRNRIASSDEAELPLCEEALTAPDEIAALEALWSLHTVAALDEDIATQLLESAYPSVRAWTVRLLADRRRVGPQMADRLAELATREPAIQVRQQLACAAARLPAHQALPIIEANIQRDIDHADPYLPLLWWWAVERHCVSDRDEVVCRFERPAVWQSQLGRQTLLPRLIRRYAAEATLAGWDSVVRLLAAAPDAAARNALWLPVLEGWHEQPRESAAAFRIQGAPTHPLSQRALAAWKANPNDPTLHQLVIELGHREPFVVAMRDAFDPNTDEARRVFLLGLLGPTDDPSLVDPSLDLVVSQQPEPVRAAALRILARFDDPRIAHTLLRLHQSRPSSAFNSQIRDVLLSRKSLAHALLHAVDRGDVPAAVIPLEQVRRVALLADRELDTLLTKHWGHLEAGTREELLAEVRRLNNDLRAGPGHPAAGQSVFKKHCANCHQLFGEGKKLGPDLTSANRLDRDFLLVSLVDPSSVIRKEFMSVIVQTIDGRLLAGLPVAREDSTITLDDGNNSPVVIAESEIEELRESPVSIMPADLYRQLAPQELRDLFAYLQSDNGN